MCIRDQKKRKKAWSIMFISNKETKYYVYGVENNI